ncbi:flagellar assembly protein FliH [Allopusillimonas ginsengisoli]|uniref:flagellar assembly protein FliH n=1 Tax=Allopusillimonas ginsengisoli TaxID=453575 RepID=UPI00101F0E21|nr:flagellar assembly protein FliH [Allopusillimonas ginsengisoli]TEA79396.1 flagellar assembly protein FliH [Allopusillimonas ginsengisoli]
MSTSDCAPGQTNPLPWQPWKPDELLAHKAVGTPPEPLCESHAGSTHVTDAEQCPLIECSRGETTGINSDHLREEAYALGHAQGYAQGFAEGMADGRASGYDNGYEEGSTAGRHEGYAKIHAEIERLTTLADACAASLEQLESSVGEALVNLAVCIARRLVKNSLAAQSEAILELVRDVLADYQGNHVLLTLRMHPDDLQLVRDQIETIQSSCPWRLVADSSIERGGCAACSAVGDIDATLPTRWERILGSLGRPRPSPGSSQYGD